MNQLRSFFTAICLLGSTAAQAQIGTLPVEASYYLRLNGQELGQPLGESYNFFTQDAWPLQFYHAINLYWNIDERSRVGAGVSGVQDLNRGVQSRFGYVIEPQISIFHPSVSYSRASVIDNERVNLWLGLTAYLPTSKFARERATLTTLGLDQSWTIKQPVSRLSVGLSSTLEYSLYSRARGLSTDDGKRLVFISAGHFANYQLSPKFNVATSTLFDFESCLNSAPGLRSLERDRLKLQLNYYPVPVGLRVGTYAEGKLSLPHRTIVGFDFSANI